MATIFNPLKERKKLIKERNKLMRKNRRKKYTDPLIIQEIIALEQGIAIIDSIIEFDKELRNKTAKLNSLKELRKLEIENK